MINTQEERQAMHNASHPTCEDCGGEIVREKTSTGEYRDQDEADSYEYPNRCSTCAAKRRDQEPGPEGRDQ